MGRDGGRARRRDQFWRVSRSRWTERRGGGRQKCKAELGNDGIQYDDALSGHPQVEGKRDSSSFHVGLSCARQRWHLVIALCYTHGSKS